MSATVLIVDDELPFVETMSKRLARRNIHIFSAGNGPDALDVLARESEVDLVILDVKMPGMDGIQTLRQIKAAHPRVEVVMLTGHAAMETALEGMKLGALDYLTKPCSIEQIMAKVAEAIEKRSNNDSK